MSSLLMMFNYDFMVKALVAGIAISVLAALISPIIILKNYSMIGDGLSHVAFGLVSIASILNILPLPFTIIGTMIAAFIIMNLSESKRGDEAIALFSTGFFAIGVFLVSMVEGVNNNITSYLFGSILAISNTDLYISLIILILGIIFFVINYQKIFSLVYDEEFAFATGMNVKKYNSLIALFTALIIVIGMKLMGSLLISALIIFPGATSMKLSNSYRGVTIISLIISVISFLIGLILSFYLGSPVSSTIVIVHLIIYFLSNIKAKLFKS